MDAFLGHYLNISLPLAYVIIFLGMMIEGDVTLFTAVFLSRQGILDLGPSLLVATGGVLVGDFLWFWAGRKLHENSRFYRWAMRLAEPFDRHLTDRPYHAMFISKFVYGVGHIVIMRTAALKFKLRRFARIDLPATLFWVVCVAVFAYLAGTSFELFKSSFRFAEFGLLAGLVMLFLIQGVITYEVKKPRRK